MSVRRFIRGGFGTRGGGSFVPTQSVGTRIGRAPASLCWRWCWRSAWRVYCWWRCTPPCRCTGHRPRWGKWRWSDHKSPAPCSAGSKPIFVRSYSVTPRLSRQPQAIRRRHPVEQAHQPRLQEAPAARREAAAQHPAEQRRPAIQVQPAPVRPVVHQARLRQTCIRHRRAACSETRRIWWYI